MLGHPVREAGLSGKGWEKGDQSSLPAGWQGQACSLLAGGWFPTLVQVKKEAFQITG